MKKRNVLISIITIVNICIIIIIVLTILRNQMFQRKYIKELYERNSDCKNYIITVSYTNFNDEEFNYKEKHICKDNIYKQERKDVIWLVDDKLISESTKEVIIHPSKFYNSLIYESTMYRYMDDTNSEYKFIKIEEYNGTKCIVVEFKEESIRRYWLEKETGIVLKEELYDADHKIINRYTYDVKINCVQDEDLKLPDTSSYTVRNAMD